MTDHEIIHVGGRKQVPHQQIVMLKAESNYTNIILQNGSSLIVATTLGTIAKRVTHLSFFRPNRSTVINLAYLKMFDNDDSQILMQNDEVITLSRRRTKRFQKYFRVFNK
jgi:DNA-binding LytR/AlgR family response regulator